MTKIRCLGFHDLQLEPLGKANLWREIELNRHVYLNFGIFGPFAKERHFKMNWISLFEVVNCCKWRKIGIDELEMGLRSDFD